MPSITYIEDGSSSDGPNLDDREIKQSAPEPPTRYDAGSQSPMQPRSPQYPESEEIEAYSSARRFVTAAQIMAVVSLIVGGVVLSAASLVVAIIASRKVKQSLLKQPSAMSWDALKRASTIAIVMAVLALTANIVALVVVLPMVMDAMQTGEYASLLSGSPQTQPPTTNPGTSTWG